jgi:GntR family transcriptional regulator
MDAAIVRDPVYLQVNEALRALIRGGEFGAGARFLTEREVVRRFRVSRPTANKALSNLVSEGTLEFRKGVGTFVRAGVMDYDLRSLVSFTDKARAAGRRPSTRVLDFRLVQVEDLPPKVAAHLGLANRKGLVYSLERLRLADGRPVIYERRFFNGVRCPGMTRTMVKGSLYDAWTRRYKLDIVGADQLIRAVALRKGEAKRLGARPGAAALQVVSVGYLADREPLWWERTLYRGDGYEFRNALGPVQVARPAAGRLVPMKEDARS